MAQRIGLYGGSFNPIHNGHLIVARDIAERINLDQIILLPASHPPHKDAGTLLDPAHRAAMVKLAIEGDPLFAFSDFDLKRSGPNYTIETVMHFREVLGPDVALHWLIGADSLAELITWRRVSDLVNACRIVTAGRQGCTAIDWTKLASVLSDEQVTLLKSGVLPTAQVDISSSDIRRRVSEGRSIRYLVPDPLRSFIDRNGLYRSIL